MRNKIYLNFEYICKVRINHNKQYGIDNFNKAILLDLLIKSINWILVEVVCKILGPLLPTLYMRNNFLGWYSYYFKLVEA